MYVFCVEEERETMYERRDLRDSSFYIRMFTHPCAIAFFPVDSIGVEAKGVDPASKVVVELLILILLG